MKIVSEVHFERMRMMSRVFETQSKIYEDSLPEFEASKTINDLIENLANPKDSDFKKIENILTNVDNVRRMNGSQWYDYKIHVNATLRVNGYNSQL